MGRAPCCSKVGLHRGPWTPREDALLSHYIQTHGEGNWRNLPKNAGLLRCGKSCRLRWMNYLRPDIKRGNIVPEEEDLIIRLHKLLGNRWSLIAGRLPGRTDNEIKNYWNSHLSKQLKLQRSEPKPKTLNNGRIKKKQDKDKKKEISAETQVKTKMSTRNEIHTPKPIRVRGVFTNCCNMEANDRGLDCRIATTASEDKVDSSVDNYGIDWSSIEDGNLFIEQDSQSHLLDCDFPSEENLFGRLIYLEFSQLLINSDEEQLQINNFFVNSLLDEKNQ